MCLSRGVVLYLDCVLRCMTQVVETVCMGTCGSAMSPTHVPSIMCFVFFVLYLDCVLTRVIVCCILSSPQSRYVYLDVLFCILIVCSEMFCILSVC